MMKFSEKWRESSIFKSRRLKMVEEQIRRRGIRDKNVLEAMEKVPRHLFVLPEFREEAYNDYPLPIGHGQTISQPYIVAAMTEALLLKGREKVLEIGTGSGYQTAILAEISDEVCTIERDPDLLSRARVLLEELGYENIKYKVGDGTLGWEEEAPFDRILVTAGAPYTPPPLEEQLKRGGILVIPLGNRYSQVLTRIYKKKEGDLHYEELFDCAFVPLVGEYGF
jgi:protein-L-isoaspartate(D-aspartate) O-methyltransferase